MITNEHLETLLQELFQLLRSEKKTLSLAESCTGGLLSSRFTQHPGVSDFFLGSIVSYANSAKVKILSVSPKTLESFGAVSEEVALEMARGASTCFGSDYQISITGIAGPSGGTPLKPVGCVCFAVRGPQFEISTTKQFSEKSRRQEIQQKASLYAVQFLLDQIRAHVQK